MLSFLKKRWFLLSLVGLIALGISLGARLPLAQAAAIGGFVNPRWITAIVLFLMSFSLDSRQLSTAFLAPRPVLWASLVNFGFIPAAAWCVMGLQATPDFSVGLMIAASVPCTMAAASVWTRKAGGNDAVSLLVTVLTNGSCFLITPLWLNLTISGETSLSAGAMVLRLVVAVLIPTLLGQLVRRIDKAARIAADYKTTIGVVAQGCILLIVFSAACKAGERLGGDVGSVTATGIALVWGSCIVIHVSAMAVGLFGARVFKFSKADRIAVVFAGSQKTLPIGVLLATDAAMYGDPNFLAPGVGIPFVVFPMLMFHASQLVIDTIVADRFAAAADEGAGETR